MDSSHGCRASHRSTQGSQRGKMSDQPPSPRSPRLRVKLPPSSWEWCIRGCDLLDHIRAQIGDAREKSAGLACGKCWQLCASGHECLLLSERNRSSASAARNQVTTAHTSLGVKGCGRVGESESCRLIKCETADDTNWRGHTANSNRGGDTSRRGDWLNGDGERRATGGGCLTESALILGINPSLRERADNAVGLQVVLLLKGTHRRETEA